MENEERTALAETKDKVMDALREVYDPEIGMNVVELGLIRNIQVSPSHVHIEMILTTPFCPYAPAMLQEVRDAADIAAGRPSTVELGAQMWDPSMMEEGADEWGLF